MRKNKNIIKKIVEEKIKERHKKIIFIENKMLSKTEYRKKLRISGNQPVKPNIQKKYIINKYVKKQVVNYDVVICIPSYNRYKKVQRLISQFYNQPTKYYFKIILLNDGSNELEYDKLLQQYPDIIYLKNEKPNGKILHWYCYNQMWECLKNIEYHFILQLDDDFILCDNFLNMIIDLFFTEKEKNNNMMAIAPHLWSFNKKVDFEPWWTRNNFIDGIGLIDEQVITYLNYELKPVDIEEVSKVGVPAGAWTQIARGIIDMGGIIYQTKNSLVYHDGNDESKLHPNARKGGGMFTQKYIGKL